MAFAPRITLADLNPAERERFYEFLVVNKVEFVSDNAGQSFVATVRVVHPVRKDARLAGGVKTVDCAKGRQIADKKTQLTKSRSMGQLRQGKLSLLLGAEANAAPAPKYATAFLAAHTILRNRYTQFCSFIPPLESSPKTLQTVQLTRFIQEVYDEHFKMDTHHVRMNSERDLRALQQESRKKAEYGERRALNFPEYVFEFAAKRYGLKQLVSQNCWGLVSSVEILREQNHAIETFARLLDETYSDSDVMFLLVTRDHVMKILELDATAQAPGHLIWNCDPSQNTFHHNTNLKKTAHGDGFLMDGVQLNSRQCLSIVRRAVDQSQGSLRQAMYASIDAAMRDPDATVLEAARLLAVMTEVYHNAKVAALPLPLQTPSGGEAAEGTLAVLDHDARKALKESRLPPSVLAEVRESSQGLLNALAKQGESNVTEADTYDWSLNVAIRRIEAPAKAKSEAAAEIQQLMLDAWPAPLATGEAAEDMEIDFKNFANDLERNVKLLLIAASKQLVAEIVGELSGGKSEDVAGREQAALLEEFAPVTDKLMEAVVASDFNQWLATLKISAPTDAQQQHFRQLRTSFQQMIENEISAHATQRICQTVTSTPELRQAVRASALDIASPRPSEAGDEDEVQRLPSSGSLPTEADRKGSGGRSRDRGSLRPDSRKGMASGHRRSASRGVAQDSDGPEDQGSSSSVRRTTSASRRPDSGSPERLSSSASPRPRAPVSKDDSGAEVSRDQKSERRSVSRRHTTSRSPSQGPPDGKEARRVKSEEGVRRNKETADEAESASPSPSPRDQEPAAQGPAEDLF